MSPNLEYDHKKIEELLAKKMGKEKLIFYKKYWKTLITY